MLSKFIDKWDYTPQQLNDIYSFYQNHDSYVVVIKGEIQ